MARISVSISEDLKEQLYQKSTETGIPISHLVTQALMAHLHLPSQTVIGPDLSQVLIKIEELSTQVAQLKSGLPQRVAPTGVKFF